MDKKPVELSTIVVQSKGVIASEIDGEVVMMNVALGLYSWLDDIGSEIWNLLESPRQVSEICEILMGRYDVKENECQTDVLAFLKDIVAKGIVTVDESAI